MLTITTLGASSTSPAPSPACLLFLISASSWALSRSGLTPDTSVTRTCLQISSQKVFSARESQSISSPTYSVTIWKIIDQNDLGAHISRLSCELTLPGTGFKSVIRSIRQPLRVKNPSETFKADSFSLMTLMISAGIFATFVLLLVARCRIFVRVEREKPKCRQ